jgi:hypothetical protein
MKQHVWFVCLLAAIVSSPLCLCGDEQPKDISDNSFLIEEAYNQDVRVVQHIFNFSRDWQSGTWGSTFTQEWPAFGVTHQLSYTLALAGGPQLDPGLQIGQTVLNYRYQLLAGDALSMAPRLSVIIPGHADPGLGYGVGVQAMIPASVTLSKRFVTHLNLGATWYPSAGDVNLPLWQATYGASLIYKCSSTCNLMLECVGYSGQQLQPDAGGIVRQWQNAFVVNPGARFAINFPSGLQIVYGAAIPLQFANGETRASLFLYLSFEHPY